MYVNKKEGCHVLVKKSRIETQFLLHSLAWMVTLTTHYNTVSLRDNGKSPLNLPISPALVTSPEGSSSPWFASFLVYTPCWNSITIQGTPQPAIMPFEDLLSSLREDIGDPEEESFLLFSQKIPSQDLGFVDAKAASLEITVDNRDLIIQQSPTLLSSNREGGTTGAVIWKITPLFAQWIASDDNILFRSSVLNQSSTVLELGSGSSGIVAIALAHRICKYFATDQEYVFKLLKANIEENNPKQKESGSSIVKHRGKSRVNNGNAFTRSNIKVFALDWESSLISSLPAMMDTNRADVSKAVSAVIACDCVYNESLSKALFGIVPRLENAF